MFDANKRFNFMQVGEIARLRSPIIYQLSILLSKNCFPTVSLKWIYDFNRSRYLLKQTTHVCKADDT